MVYFLYLVRAILFPFILAFILVYLFNPLLEKLVARGMPRMGALIFVGGVLVALIAFGLVTIIPALIDELEVLVDRIPQYLRQLQVIIDRFNRRYHRVDIPPLVGQIIEGALARVREFSLGFVERTSEAVLEMFHHFLGLVIAPVLAFYILKDLESLESYFWSLIPDSHKPELENLLLKINRELFAFLKGQLTVCFLVGLASTLGLLWLGVKFALLLGITAGVLNIIPYFGPIISYLPVVLVASLESSQLAIKVTVLFVVIQQFEGNILVPKIMEEEMGLHPALIIFSLLAGGELFGILGMVIAIPVVAIVKELLYYVVAFS